MRIRALVGAVVGITLITVAWSQARAPSKESVSERVARLIKQLGDDEFAKRQAASKELDSIGLPAMRSLRKAAASSEDLEIRHRARRLTRAIADRTRKTDVTGRWTGYGVTSLGQQNASGELVITEEPDGTLTGKWGAPMHLTIEEGERVAEDTLQWESSHSQGTYRARCTQKGNSLVIDWTFTHESDEGQSCTGTIVLTKSS